MYSVVLAAMLTTGPAAAPAWGHGCHGCCGGYNAFSCCGGYSCCGGWSMLLRRLLLLRRLVFIAVAAGLRAAAAAGTPPATTTRPTGAAAAMPAPSAAAATPAAAAAPGRRGYSCCGGGWYRGAAGWVPVPVCPGGVVVAPGTAAPPPMPKLPEPAEKQSAAAAAPATVVIKAPMDVRITVNGQATDRQSAEQIFTTPDLQPGKTYSYDFRAEAVRDGKTVTRTQTVIVKAGQESRADFGDLTAADAPAHVTITAPADARLTVDGVEIPAAARTLQHAAAGGGADVLLHGDGGDDARRPQGQRQPARAGFGRRGRVGGVHGGRRGDGRQVNG